MATHWYYAGCRSCPWCWVADLLTAHETGRGDGDLGWRRETARWRSVAVTGIAPGVMRSWGRTSLASAVRGDYNQGVAVEREVVVRRIEDRYQSGLVEVRWIAECVICSAHAEVGTEPLARQWETAHAQHRCGHRLVRDETGRGWVPDQFATPGGRRG